MDPQLWTALVAVLRYLRNPRSRPRQHSTDPDIVKVWYWAVIHDRPVRWACQPCHWPAHLRKRPLPSDSWMSRRLRSDSARALLEALERRVIAPKGPGLFW